MSWAIQQQGEPGNAASFDGSIWTWRLRNVEREHRLVFQVTGTAMCMSDDALPRGGSLARATTGRSEVEQVLGWETPPVRIEVNSMGVRHWGGSGNPRSVG
jgi:hypothetical protein